jgi:hypothetical protein
MDEKKLAPPRLECAPSLRPNERMMDAYIERKPYAVAVIGSWKALQTIPIVRVTPAEWERLQRNDLVFHEGTATQTKAGRSKARRNSHGPVLSSS